MGRSRSRRRRGKSGGQGSGGSGKGKGTGGSRGRSSGTRGGAGKGGSGSGKGTGGSKGRSNNTRGGQSKANKNQNKKAKANRTINSIKSAVGASFKGLAAKAGTHVANSQYNNQLKKANWTKRDMSKLTPQQQRKYQRLSEKTGRDYSIRKPTFRLNLNADTLARFGKFQNAGWYTGLTNRFPGIKKLKINKQFYGNPTKKGWHSSQRTGRGQGLPSVAAGLLKARNNARVAEAQARQQNEAAERQYDYDNRAYDARRAMLKPRGVPNTLVKPPSRSIRGPQRPTQPAMGPQQDWLGDLYSSHNINQGKLDQSARDYWSNEAKTKGRDAVMQSIIGTSKAQGTYGGRSKNKPMKLKTTSNKNKSTRRNRQMKSLAATIGAIRGGVG